MLSLVQSSVLTTDKSVSGDSQRMREVWISWSLVALWMLFIFVLSAQSALGGMEWPPIYMALRKSGHILEYAALGVLLGRALSATWSERGGKNIASRAMLARTWWVGVLLATLYAATDEFHQSFVPQRGAHIEDVAIDALSATAALGIWYIMRNRRHK